MNYREVLSKAWKIVWKNKILWLFGILAGCGAVGGNRGGSGGSSGGSSAASNNFSRLGANPSSIGNQFLAIFNNIGEYISQNLWIIALLVLMIVLFAFITSILSFFVGALGTGGVIKGAILRDEENSENKRLSFSEIFKALKPYYWRIVLLHLLIIGVGLLASFLAFGLIIGLIVFTLGIGFIFLIPIILLMIPIGSLVQVIIKNSTIALIDENMSVFQCIARGWEVTIGNLGSMIVMMIILGVGQFIIGFLIIIPLIFSFFPFAISWLSNEKGVIIAALIISLLLLALFIVVAIIMSGILKAYILTAWTLNYRRAKLTIKPALEQGSIETDSKEK